MSGGVLLSADASVDHTALPVAIKKRQKASLAKPALLIPGEPGPAEPPVKKAKYTRPKSKPLNFLH